MTPRTWDDLEREVDFDFFRHIDLTKTSRHPDMEALRDELIQVMRPHLAMKQVRGKFKATLMVLVSNLYAAWATDENLFLAYSRDENHHGYKAKGQYNRTGVSYTNLTQAVEALEAISYVRHKKGFQDRKSGTSRRSRLRAEGQLRAMFDQLDATAADLLTQEREPLVLKDADKQPTTYDDTQNVRAMRRRLDKINTLLGRIEVTLDLASEDLRELAKEMEDEDGDEEITSYDTSNRTLYRVFNNASWKLGGRFYGHFVQSVPSELRGGVRINGEETCELDYSGLHINMLYHQAEEPMPEGDVYAVYDLPGKPTPKVFRNEMLKGVLQRLLNAETRKQAIRSIVWEVKRKTGDKNYDENFASAMLSRFEDRHRPIAQYFCSGIGLQLQYQDALMAEHILMALHADGVPCIPIHDSFIVQAKYEDKLHDLMVEAAEKVVGAALPIDRK